ncbi:MAG: AraC family transcriptional regulator [Ilumatobacteraceae bacterium]
MTATSAAGVGKRTSREFLVETIPLPGPTVYRAHRHPQHQLAWMRAGEMELRLDDQFLRLHSHHVVWIPSNVRHEMTIPTAGELVTAYVAPHVRLDGPRWSRPVVVPADDLIAALFGDLARADITNGRRALSQTLLFDCLQSSAPSDDVLAIPRDPRARAVAETILANPADGAELVEWAERLGVSGKTLARAFAADTGMTFGRWRTTARLHHARRLLHDGGLVVEVAAAVGYSTSSAFIAAYRQRLGITPGRDARRRPFALEP